MKGLVLAFFLASAAFFLHASPADALTMTSPVPMASTAGRELAPVVIQDGLGDVHAFAPSVSAVDGRSRLYMSTYNGSGFSAPAQVTTLGGVERVAAVKQSGGAVGLVIEKGIYPAAVPFNTELFWTRNAGAGWSDPVQLTSYADRDAQPTLVDLGSNNVGLIFSRWVAYDAAGNVLPDKNDPNYSYTGTELYQMTYTAATSTWSAAVNITNTPFISEAYPSLARGPSGSLYLFYSSNDGGSWSIIGRRYQSGAWTAGSVLESGLMEQYLQQPSIINDVPGKYRLVYAQKKACPNPLCPTSNSNYSSEIRYRTYDSVTNIWADPVSVTDSSQFYADSPSALYDSNGTYWLVFRYLADKSYGSDNFAANFDIYWEKSMVNTPVGTNVTVDLGYNSSITFSNVTVAGNSTMDTSATNPGNTTGVFKIGNFYYDVNTNATYTGSMTISLKYSDAGMTAQEEANLRILHWLTASSTWEDATVSVDTVNNVLVGQVNSLSWITIASMPTLTWLSPVANVGSGGVYILESDEETLPIKFRLVDGLGNFVDDPTVRVRVSGNGGEALFVRGDGKGDIRFDAESGTYKLNFKTKGFSFIEPGNTYTIKVLSGSVDSDLWVTSFKVASEEKESFEDRATHRSHDKEKEEHDD